MKGVICFSFILIFLFGCASKGKQTSWVKRTNSEQSKQKMAINDCRLQASKHAGQRPIAQQVPQCLGGFNPACSFSQGQAIGENQKAQEGWQQLVNSAFQSCMYEKGYEEG
tara:strand:- start:258 stop:590 length:333 start_codon:yes stop_codon:yes gene_type:complete